MRRGCVDGTSNLVEYELLPTNMRFPAGKNLDIDSPVTTSMSHSIIALCTALASNSIAPSCSFIAHSSRRACSYRSGRTCTPPQRLSHACFSIVRPNGGALSPAISAIERRPKAPLTSTPDICCAPTDERGALCSDPCLDELREMNDYTLPASPPQTARTLSQHITVKRYH